MSAGPPAELTTSLLHLRSAQDEDGIYELVGIEA
jgi:hypothetical protein